MPTTSELRSRSLSRPPLNGHDGTADERRCRHIRFADFLYVCSSKRSCSCKTTAEPENCQSNSPSSALPSQCVRGRPPGSSRGGSYAPAANPAPASSGDRAYIGLVAPRSSSINEMAAIRSPSRSPITSTCNIPWAAQTRMAKSRGCRTIRRTDAASIHAATVARSELSRAMSSTNSLRSLPLEPPSDVQRTANLRGQNRRTAATAGAARMVCIDVMTLWTESSPPTAIPCPMRSAAG